MKSFSIFPHKGYLNTDFQIKVFDGNSRVFYYDNNIPIENINSFRLSAGKHCIMGVNATGGIDLDNVEVEDAIRLGGSKVEAGYCFDNSPWVAAVMKDRTYFLNANTGNQYVENGLSPVCISALNERLLLLSYGAKDDYGVPKIAEYSVFDASQGEVKWRFDKYLFHNANYAVFSDTPTENGTCIHVMMRHDEDWIIVDISCKAYAIIYEHIYYCSEEDGKYKIMKFQPDGTSEDVPYCSGQKDEFVGFVLNHYYLKRSGRWLYLKDILVPNNYVGIPIHNHGGVIREINGFKVASSDLVEEFCSLVKDNKEICSKLDLHAHIVDLLLSENTDGIYEKVTHYKYSWSDIDHKRPDISCELAKQGCTENIAIGRWSTIDTANDFVVTTESDSIKVIHDGKCVRELLNISLRKTPKGNILYLKEDDEIISVYKLGALSDELIVQGKKNDINLGYVEKFAILTERNNGYRIYYIDENRWDRMVHQNYYLEEKNNHCFLRDSDEDGQCYLISGQTSPVALPVSTATILSITTKGSSILSLSPRGIILHERFSENTPYEINEKLVDAIDTSEYRNALFSDDGNHTVYNKNGLWYYYDIETGEEIEFDIDPEIVKRQRKGLYSMNFYMRYNDTNRRVDMIDPITLQKIAPAFLSDYIFVSPSGKLASKTRKAGVIRKFFLKNWDARTKEVSFKKEVTDLMTGDELMVADKYIQHFEFAYPGSQKEDWEKELVSNLVNRIGLKDKPGDKYYLQACKYTLIDIFSTEKEDDVIRIELPVNLGFLNCIVFSSDDKYVSICGKTIVRNILQRGFIGVYDLTSRDWVYGPNTPSLAIWKSFFSTSGIFAYYNSRPHAMCGDFRNGMLKEIPDRSILSFSRSGKYLAMSDKGYVPFAVNPSHWGHMKSANIYVRCVGGEKELAFSDHGDEIIGLYNSDVTCVSFSPNDKRLMSISQDGVVVIRNLHLEELQEDYETRSQRSEIERLLRKNSNDGDGYAWLELVDRYFAEGENVYYSKDKKTLIACCNDSMTEYSVREGCEVICDDAFSPCVSLRHEVEYAEVTGKELSVGNNISVITIPNSVKRIGKGAFSHCDKLTEIRIPSGCGEKFKQLIAPVLGEIIKEY